jgi:hypothetical protein
MLLRALSFVVTAVVTVVLSLFFMTYSASQSDPANAYFQATNIYRSGLQGSGMLALTFDDGPSQFTNQLLDTLAQNNVRATFFVVGSRVRHHPEVMERMMREGHVIANHSFNHARLGRRYANSPELLITQIGRTTDEIAPYTRTSSTKIPRSSTMSVRSIGISADRSPSTMMALFARPRIGIAGRRT